MRWKLPSATCACRFSITNYKQQISRPAAQSAFLKYYLDLVFIVAGAFAFYQLRQRGSLATKDVFGGLSADPILLVTPSLFMLMIALVFLRLFPLVLRVAVWLSRNIPGPTISLGLTRMVRNPVQHSRLILLLILTTAVGMFAAGFRATLEQGYEDRAAYKAGAEARIGDIRTPFAASNDELQKAMTRATGSTSVSTALRQEGYYNSAKFRSENVVVLGVETAKHFDNDGCPVEQRCGMDLRNGRRRKRDWLDCGEQLVQRTAEVRFDHVPNRRPWLGGHLIS